MNWIRRYSLYFAWVVSLAALLSSLFFEEVMHMEPCKLCWYQRIAMYPLVLFLGIATYKSDRTLAIYCLPLVILGALFALYQSLIQMAPSLHIKALCGDSCTLPSPIPFFSLFAFLLILFFILFSPKSFSENSEKS